MKPGEARSGFTLPTVLFALLLLAAIVTAAWVAAWQSVRSGRLAQGEATVRLAASARIARALSAWNVSWDSLSPGSAIVAQQFSGAIAETLTIRRTGTNVFALSSVALDTATLARRELLAFTRSIPLGMQPRTAVRLRQFPAGGLLASVDSLDGVPGGWDCPSRQDTVTTVTLQLGETDSTFYQFGTLWSWQRLISWVQRLPAGGDSLPWRLHPSSASLIGERFTGVLVVDGDLVLRQSEVIGIVIARGTIRLEWPGAAISGTVVADAIELGAGTPASAVRIGYSSCAIHLAGRSRAPARGLPGVPPADVF